MTLEQLHQKRDQILQSMGLSALQQQDKSISYTSDQQKLEALARIDAEIAKVISPRGKVLTILSSRGL